MIENGLQVPNGSVEHRELCLMLYSSWEVSLGENGYLYRYAETPSLFT